MKKFIIILLVIAFAPFAKGQISTDLAYYKEFPTYEKVLQHYFTYNAIDVQKLYYIDFAKKPDGWYVKEKSIQDWPKELTETMVWRATDQTFLVAMASPDYVSVTQEIDKTIASYSVQQLLNRPDINYLEIAPVYGYDGYEEDIFKILSNKKGLPAEQLDILARAYSSICDKMMKRLISEKHNSAFDDYFKTFKKKDISKTILDDYLKHGDKAIEKFKELTERFPNYTTIVGNIKLKYWNEHMARFYDLLQLQQPALAKKYIQQPLFDDFLIKYGKNLLNSCGKDAILFTYGDLDTYIALYVQATYNLKRDVSIVNTSLSNMDYHLRFQISENKLPHSISLDFYKNQIQSFGFLQKSEDTTSFLKFVVDAEAHPMDYTQQFNGKNYISIPSLSVSIPVNNRANIALMYGGTFAPEKSIATRFPSTAITKSQFFVFDIITTNQWKRPIYFSMGSDNGSRLYLNKYMKWEGLVFQLTPKLGLDRDRQTLSSNVSLYEMAKPSAIYTNGNTPNSAYLQYLYLYYETVRDANAAIKNDVSKQTMENLLKYFPPSEMSYLDFGSFFADNCYRLERFDEADIIILTRAKEIKAKIEAGNLNDFLRKKIVSEKAYLLGIAGKSKEKGFLDKIKKILGE